MAWFNIRDEIPWLPRSELHFVDQTSEKQLTDALSRLEFAIYTVDGESISSEQEFFRSSKNVFGFPDYCGLNWDAFHECFGEFDADGSKRVAVIWQNAHVSAQKGLYGFCRVLHELLNLQAAYKVHPDDEGVEQLEVFFVGSGEHFIGAREN